MEDEYVRKDYHDETIRRMEVLMERNLAKQEAMNAEINARVDAMSAKQEAIYTEIRGEIRNIHTRIDGVVDTFSVAINDIKESQSNSLTRWGIIVAIVVGVVHTVQL